MLHFEEGACHVLAGDTRLAFADMDKAYLASLRMAATRATFGGFPAFRSRFLMVLRPGISRTFVCVGLFRAVR